MPDPSGINPLVGRVAPPPEMPSFDLALDTAARNEQFQAYRKARIDAASDAAATQAALQQANGDPQAAIGHLMQSGKANAAGQLQKMWDAHLGEVEKQTDQHLKIQQQQAQFASNLARGITDEHSFQAVKSIVAPQYAQMLGDTYDPARIAAIQQSTLTAKELADQQHQAHVDLLAAGADGEKQYQALLDGLGAIRDQDTWQKALQIAAARPGADKARIAALPQQFSEQALKYVQDASVSQETREKRPLAAAQTEKTIAEAKAEPVKAAADLQRANTAAALAGIGAGAQTGQQPDVTAARPDQDTANRPIPGIGITPNAVYQSALSMALTGKQGTITSRAQAMQPAIKAIANKASAIAQAAGVDLPSLQREWTNSNSTTRALTQRYQLLASSATTANENIDYALGRAKSVDRSQVPAYNRFKQWLTAEVGGQSLPDLSAFELAIYTASREYAKVVSGSAASIAELSQSAAAKADQLINAAQTPQQFQKVTDVMRGDMGRVTDPLLKTIKSTPDLGDNTRKFLEFIGQGANKASTTAAKDPLGIR